MKHRKSRRASKKQRKTRRNKLKGGVTICPKCGSESSIKCNTVTEKGWFKSTEKQECKCTSCGAILE